MVRAALASAIVVVWGLSVATPAQTPALIPPPYLSQQYVADLKAPSSTVVAGNGEPGERLIVTGRALEGTTPVPGVSVYVFQTDIQGRYAIGVNNQDAELDPRLHGAMRTDANGRYQYETIRPGSYNNNAAHVHYIVTAPGYKARMFDLWFEDDPILAARRKSGASLYGTIPPQNHSWIAIRPVSRDANGIWRSTRDLEMILE